MGVCGAQKTAIIWDKQNPKDEVPLNYTHRQYQQHTLWVFAASQDAANTWDKRSPKDEVPLDFAYRLIYTPSDKSPMAYISF